MNLLIVSKNIFSVSGGAEKSIVRELEKNLDAVNTVVWLGEEGELSPFVRDINSFEFKLRISKFIGGYFPYLSYFLARRQVKKAIDSILELYEIDEVWAQGLWAPMLSASPANKIYLRDESSIGMRPIHLRGVKYLFGLAVRILELPFWRSYLIDLEKMFSSGSEIVANSIWMQEKVRSKYGHTCSVAYPDLNLPELYNDFDRNNSRPRNSIVMVGSEYVKGIHYFLRLAREFPAERFTVFAKPGSAIRSERNLRVVPWSSDRSKPFREAKVVVVPSVWNEAFGRVAAEAVALGVPVLVTRSGGLPEAVNFNEAYIADNYEQLRNKLTDILELLEIERQVITDRRSDGG